MKFDALETLSDNLPDYDASTPTARSEALLNSLFEDIGNGEGRGDFGRYSETESLQTGRVDARFASWEEPLGTCSWGRDVQNWTHRYLKDENNKNKLGIPFSVVWTHIDYGVADDTILPNFSASVRDARAAAIEQLAGERGAAEIERLDQNVVYFLTIDGPGYDCPDLVVAGPGRRSDDADRFEQIGYKALELNETYGNSYGTSLSDYVAEYLEDLAAGEDDWRRAFDESLETPSEVRDHFSRKIQGALSNLVALLAEASDDALEGDGEEVEYTDRDLDALHSAAVLLAFRVIFLSELERRGFLYADLFEEGRHKLGQYLSVLQADNAERAKWRDGDFLRRILELSEAIVDGDESVRIEGGSIFQDLPDDETFDDRIGEVFEALREWSESNDSRAFDEALAETGNLLVGRVNRGEDDDGETPSYFGAGGTEHSHRVLGDIYEEMLGLISDTTEDGTPELRRPTDDDDEDSEQKKLAAYYTPRDLVFEVVRPTLGHLFEQTWHEVGEDPAAYRRELEELTIVDPAMGSGHFLTAAALEFARELAWVDGFGTHRPFDWHEPTDNPNPIGSPPDDFEPSYIQETAPIFDPPDDEAHTPGVDEETFRRQVGRELPGVVRRSIYGVDKNPLACELGKLSLWLLSAVESDRTGEDQPDFEEYLDDNIKSGDSLVGMFLNDERTPAGLDHYDTVEELLEDAGRSSSGNLQNPTNSLLNWQRENLQDRVETIQRLRDILTLEDDELLSALDETETRGGHAQAIVDAYADRTGYELREAIQDKCRDLLEGAKWLYNLGVALKYIDYTSGSHVDSSTRRPERLAEILVGEVPDEDIKANIESKISTLLEAPFSEESEAARERLSNWIDEELVARSDARPFHWELEFPEIFSWHEEADSEDRGFDAVVANPPFIGDRDIRERLGDNETLVEYLADYFIVGDKKSEYSGFFFHRYNEIVNASGVAASLATNSIAQASNREYVTKPLTVSKDEDDDEDTSDFRVRRAAPNRTWPGNESVHFAEVVMARELDGEDDDGNLVFVRSETSDGDEIFVDHPSELSSYLDEYPDFELNNLFSDHPIVDQGLILGGYFSISQKNQSLKDAIGDIPSDEYDALAAYLNARDVQQKPHPRPSDVVIDFFEPLRAAGFEDAEPSQQMEWIRENYPKLWSRIQKRGDRFGNDNEDWYLFHRNRDAKEGLRNSWKNEYNMVAFIATTKVWSPFYLSKNIQIEDFETDLHICPIHSFYIAPQFDDPHLAVTSSLLFESIVRRKSSSLKSDLRFTPTKVMPYFPWPWSSDVDEETGELTIGEPLEETERELSAAIDDLIELRRDILENPSDHGLTRDQIGGPTDLYNVYDSDPDGEDPEPNADNDAIWELRRRHVHLLRAVLRAYARNAEESGWDDPTDDWDDLPDKWDHLADGWHDVHERATEANWTFDRPWLDRTLRYVPEESIRRDLFALIDATNSKRFEEERDKMIDVIADLLPEDGLTKTDFKDEAPFCDMPIDNDRFEEFMEWEVDDKGAEEARVKKYNRNWYAND